jgi:hypothetical protein
LVDEARTPALRELFIEDLALVQGGTSTGIEKIKETIRELLLTTMACGEEGPSC